jgi:hypothetical protein
MANINVKWSHDYYAFLICTIVFKLKLSHRLIKKRRWSIKKNEIETFYSSQLKQTAFLFLMIQTHPRSWTISDENVSLPQIEQLCCVSQLLTGSVLLRVLNWPPGYHIPRTEDCFSPSTESIASLYKLRALPLSHNIKRLLNLTFKLETHLFSLL